MGMGFPNGSEGKESACNAGDQERWVSSLGWEDLLGKKMATHSSILAKEIPWTEEPGGLQYIGLQRVGHNQEHNLTFENGNNKSIFVSE